MRGLLLSLLVLVPVPPARDIQPEQLASPAGMYTGAFTNSPASPVYRVVIVRDGDRYLVHWYSIRDSALAYSSVWTADTELGVWREVYDKRPGGLHGNILWQPGTSGFTGSGYTLTISK